MMDIKLVRTYTIVGDREFVDFFFLCYASNVYRIRQERYIKRLWDKNEDSVYFRTTIDIRLTGDYSESRNMFYEYIENE